MEHVPCGFKFPDFIFALLLLRTQFSFQSVPKTEQSGCSSNFNDDDTINSSNYNQHSSLSV